MSKAITRPNAADMVLAVQNYRTSLESLMHVGKTILDTPNVEEQSAVSFTVLAENVLEEAGHQEDLEIVEGVDEPAAKVELIMQDVLQPRIMESEKIETTLAAKAANEVPTPFTTSNAMTESPAMESLKQQAEVLALYHDNVRLAKVLVSMEGADIDVIRPTVMETLSKFSGQTDVLGVSMEAVGQTQVLGELSDAVSRVEQLVERARESVDDKIGAQLDEDVSMTTVDNDTEELEGDIDGEDAVREGSDDHHDDIEDDDLDPEDDDGDLEDDSGDHPLEDTPMSDVEYEDDDDAGEAVEEEEDDSDESDGAEEEEDVSDDELEDDDPDVDEDESEEEEVEYEEDEDEDEIELEDDDEYEEDEGEDESEEEEDGDLDLEEETEESDDEDEVELEEDDEESDDDESEEDDDVTHISLDDDDDLELEDDDD